MGEAKRFSSLRFRIGPTGTEHLVRVYFDGAEQKVRMSLPEDPESRRFIFWMHEEWQSAPGESKAVLTYDP